MQSHAHEFAEAGIALYAVSYDEVAGLANYATGHEVSFPLLSDPDSEIIKRFGILNTLIDPDDHPWYGIPFPGVYVTDADGVITAKFFENSLFHRPSADQLLHAALGTKVAMAPRQVVDEVKIEVGFDGSSFHAGIIRDLVARFAVPEGQHLYGEPTPVGLVATRVTIDDQEGLEVRAAVMPPTRPLTLADTDDTLQVFEGDVEIRVPITHAGRSLIERDDDTTVLRLTGTVRWQACDESACGLPQSETFSIDIPAAGYNAMDRVDAPLLFEMQARRTDTPFLETFAKQTGPNA